MDKLDLINTLNEQQRKIVLQTEGAVLVTAGAGSGKTRVLTHRVAYLISQGVSPYNILAITFTNKAAQEMKERVEQLVENTQDMWICTFHSLCVRILRQFADRIGFSKSFSIYGEQEKENIVKRILVELNIDEDKKKTFVYHISNAKNQNLSVEEYKKEYAFVQDIDNICKVYEQYQKELFVSNAFDFDDLLIKTYELLLNCQEAREKFQDRFQYILIDEFQDTNKVQYDIAKILSSKYGNIMVVGDEDQCIYGWRGANIENILNFQYDFNNVKIYKLEQNYRCTKSIIDIANCVIKNNEQRLDKVLFTNNQDGAPIELFVGANDVQEAEFISRRIKQLVSEGYQYKDIAVLMRYNALSRPIEESLLTANIPYKVLGGMKFYERAEIKNILAYLKVIVNHQDNESLIRIINFPKRGIGQTSINNLKSMADEHNLSMLEYIMEHSDNLTNALKTKIIHFKELIIELQQYAETSSLVETVEKVIEKTKIREMYADKNTEEDANRIKNIESLVTSIYAYSKTYPNDTLFEYLQAITLLSDADDKDDANNTVILATIHAVKGLEFRAVFVVGLEEENFPILRNNEIDDIEEERRLFYVAVTRAKERLYLSRCESRFKFGQIKRFITSRFLNELKDNRNIKKVYFNLGYNLDKSYNFANNNYNQNSNSTYRSVNQENNFIKSIIQTMAYNMEDKSFDGFVVGAKVEHPKFGVGVIIDTSKLQSANLISVEFEDVGVKNLTFNVSPLTLI